MEVWAKLPSDPVERIRSLKVLREVYRRRVKPELKETYRRRGGKTYGPYYIAYFKRTREYRNVRTIYLGKENPSIEFVAWLAEQSKRAVLKAAEIVLRRARGVVKELNNPDRADLARALGRLSPDDPEAETPSLEDLIHFVPFLGRLIGPWPAWFSERVLRKFFISPPDGRSGSQSDNDVKSVIEKWNSLS